MPSYFGSDFDRVVRWAKTIITFRLRTKNNLLDGGSECDGLTVCNDDGTFTIYLDRNQDHSSAIYSLLEELAHCTDHLRRGLSGDHQRDHDAKWGAAYSTWRRAYWDKFGEE